MIRWILALSLISSAALADVTVKYRLSTNSQIESHCTVDGQRIASKLKVDRFEPETDPARVIISARMCTKGYGYQRADVEVKIPSVALSEENLLAMQVGQSLKGKGVTWKRNVNKGTVAWYQMTFATSPVSAKITMGPVQFAVETDPAKAAAIRAKAGGRFVWAALALSFKHSWVSSPFVLNGTFDTIE